MKDDVLTKGQVMYSERVSNKDLLNSTDESALFIKNTDKANYIGMILNGTKTVETRDSRTLNAFIGKEMPVTDGKYVYGYMTIGEPYRISAEDFHKKENQKKHRVPVGDEYDVKAGKGKWAYPIESVRKTEKKKLSDTKDYKYSFQAREVKYSLRGINKDGIEVYETSARIMSMPKSERIKELKKLIVSDYTKKTARFTRNGHEYRASLDSEFAGKTIYGEGHFSRLGKNAYIRTALDGELFNLVENSTYNGSSKDTKNHKQKDRFTDYFDYFVKNVQIDDVVYGLYATVKKSYAEENGYTYTLFLTENKNIKPSPVIKASSIESETSGLNVIEDASKKDSIINSNNNQGKNSDRNTDSTDNRTLLSNALLTTAQNDIEKNYIKDYQSNIENLNKAQSRLAELRAEIKRLSFSKGKRDTVRISQLKDEATKML